MLKPSAVKPVFTTIDQRLVIRALGKMAAADQGALRRAIGEVVSHGAGSGEGYSAAA